MGWKPKNKLKSEATTELPEAVSEATTELPEAVSEPTTKLPEAVSEPATELSEAVREAQTSHEILDCLLNASRLEFGLFERTLNSLDDDQVSTLTWEYDIYPQTREGIMECFGYY